MRKINCKDSANREQNCQACLSCFAEMQPILWKDNISVEQYRACQSYLILILSGIVNKRKFPDIVRLFFRRLAPLGDREFFKQYRHCAPWANRKLSLTLQIYKQTDKKRKNCVQFYVQIACSFFIFNNILKTLFLRYVIAL